MKKTILIILTLCLILTLCACDGTNTDDTASDGNHALSVVIGCTEVFPRINPNIFYDAVYNSMYHFSNITGIVADGEAAMGVDVLWNRPENLNNAKHKQLAGEYTEKVMRDLSSLTANDAESDALAAIQMATDTLRGSGSEKKTMLVISSGLNTTGALNFASSNLLETDPEWIAAQLADINSIPDLDGIDVIWMGMGQTAGHQSPLDANNRAKLTAIWTAVLQAGNPASLTIDPTPLADIEPKDGLPLCSAVSFVTSTLSAPQQVSEQEQAPAVQDDTVIRFDEASVCFLPDQAVLADREAASNALKPIAAQLLQSNIQVVLAGTTASVGGDGIELSEARAEAIKQVLVEEFAVPADQIRCVGLGRRDWSMRAHDLDSNGALIEKQAKLNRAVFLFSSDSACALELGL